MYGENYIFKDLAVPAATGVYDTTRDVVDMVTNGVSYETTKYESEVLNMHFSGYIIPEIVGVGPTKRLGMVAHGRLV